MRISVAVSARQPDEIEQAINFTRGIRAPCQSKAMQRAIEDRRHCLAWIQRGVRILEDDLRTPAEIRRRDLRHYITSKPKHPGFGRNET